MRKFKKLMSLFLAGVMAVTALFCGTVTASAATEKTSLLKATFSQIDSKASTLIWLGQDLYMLTDDKEYRAVYRIGEEELKNWRSTGKIKGTKITVDSRVSKYTYDVYDRDYKDLNYSDYIELRYQNVKDETVRNIMRYDKEKNKLRLVYSTTNEIGVSSDGTMSEFIVDRDTNKLVIKILNNKGKLVKQLRYDFSSQTQDSGIKFNGQSYYARWEGFKYGSDYAYLLYFYAKDLAVSDSGDLVGGHIMTIDKNGKTEIISDLATPIYTAGSNYIAINPFYWNDAGITMDVGYHYIYLTEKNKLYDISDLMYFTDSSGNNYNISIAERGFGESFSGTKTIVRYSNDGKYKYALVDINSKKIIGSVYDHMSTWDNGKTFLVLNSDGKWGFINAKGKELAFFDGADCFSGNGKYAPVMKDGKIYLVDKNMKRVSKYLKTDDDSWIWTYGDEIFLYGYGGKYYLMTNKQ